MVGLTIGVISMAVVMQVYSGFEGQKRTTTAGGDAQSSGSVALYLMEREIKMGGNGMSEGVPSDAPPLTGCATWIHDNGGDYWRPDFANGSVLVPSGSRTAIRLAPAIITDGGATGETDTLSIAYGTAAITAPYELAANFDAGTMAVTTLNLVGGTGIRAGDMLALVGENPPATPVPKNNYRTPYPCALVQATAATATGAIAVAANRYNTTLPASGNAGVFAGGATYAARAYNLGQLNIVTYRVVNGNLVADTAKFGVVPDGTAAGAAVANSNLALPISNGIVNMQVQYGIDTGRNNPTASCNHTAAANDADAIIDSWVDATGAWANNAAANSPTIFNTRRIRAVRIGLVARSSVLERDCATNPVTTAAPVIAWDDGTTVTPNLAATDANWQCYRYKVYQTTINLRNTTWSATMNPASAASCR